jgi:acetate kinase
MSKATLVFNAGSSSLKFAVFEQAAGLPLLMRGSVSSLDGRARLKVSNAQGELAKDEKLGAGPITIQAALGLIADEIRQRGLLERISTVGHRIVHGGHTYAGPAKLDEDAVDTLRGLIPLAPIHQPRNLEVIELAAALLPGSIQVGCFDTAFHLSRPRIATLYGLPRELTESGIVSYGFHGISYGYIASKLGAQYGAQAGGRTIVAHLGSGASLCAMKDGKSVATTMGFSTLDGLVMSTRCGSLDVGVVLHLLEGRQMSKQELTHLLYEKAGLLGVSGISGDMQTLLDSNDPGAREAVDLFVYRAGREIGSMAAAAGGLDTLVFTAGIGENSAIIRERICQAASWLNVRIDPERNARNDPTISAEDSAVDVLVVPADEERAVAEQLLSSPLGENTER